MKRSIPLFGFLIFALAAVGSASAFQYYALSTHPCAVTDCDGGTLSFITADSATGGYYAGTSDYGVTDMNINESGDYSQISAIESQGYRFKGWWTKKDGWTSTVAEVDQIDMCLGTNLTISAAKIKTAGQWGGRPTIVAKYVPIYDIGTAVEPADTGSVTGAGTYEKGSAVTLTAKANAGWAFEKWTNDATDNPLKFTASASATYTAVFKPLFKTVTLEKTGGSGGTDSVVVTNGLPLPKIAVPTRTGYDFKGYYTSETGDDATQYYTANGTSAMSWDANEKATALFARWQAKTFTVKFNNGGATSGPSPLTVTYGEDPGPLNIVPVKADYKFVGYYLGTACYWNGAGEWVGGSGWTFIPEEGSDVILTAHYEADQYTVGFNANGGSGSYEDKNVAVDAQFDLPDGKSLSKARHKFIGWALSSDGVKAYDGGAATTVADNKGAASQNPNVLTFYAVWLDLSCTVRFNAGSDEATADPETKQVEAGAAFGELATALWAGDRCTLVGWWNKDGKRIVETSIVPEGVSAIDLYARWTTNGYSVAFHENEGSGTMNAQAVPFYRSVALSPNRFVRAGYHFVGWATNAADAVAYADGATVRNLATTKDAVVNLYAKWTANDYAVAFYGNGGTNTMATQAFTYDVEQALTSNRFVREGFTFVGWATDPTNGVAYADGAKVKNLTTTANGTAALYAKWTKGASPVRSEYSQALDCGEIDFSTADAAYCTIVDDACVGGSSVKIAVEPGQNLNAKELLGTVSERGRLTFVYKTSIVTPRGSAASKKSTLTLFGQATTNTLEETDQWTTFSMDWNDGNIHFELKRLNNNGFYYTDSDGDCVYIDYVRWEPAVTNALTVGVTFRDAEGRVFTNVTRNAGEAYGALPVPTDPLGREFYRWECAGTTIDETWSVPGDAQGVEVRSVWSDAPIVPTGTYVIRFEVPSGLERPGDMNCSTGKVYRLPDLPAGYMWRRSDESARLYDGGMLVFDLTNGARLEMEAVRMP